MTSAVKDIRVDNIAKLKNNLKKVFIETYGCQMNFADSEVVLSILKKNKYHECKNASESDLILERN